MNFTQPYPPSGIFFLFGWLDDDDPNDSVSEASDEIVVSRFLLDSLLLHSSWTFRNVTSAGFNKLVLMEDS